MSVLSGDALGFRESFVEIEFHPVDDGTSQGEFVRVFQVVADGDAFGDGADDQFFLVFQFLEDVISRGVTFYGGAECENYFANRLSVDAFQQGIDVQVGGTDAVHGRNDATQHVVKAVVLGSGFNGQDVFDVFHHADGAGVPFGVAANVAQFSFRNVVATTAFPNVRFQIPDALDERVDLVCVPF